MGQEVEPAPALSPVVQMMLVLLYLIFLGLLVAFSEELVPIHFLYYMKFQNNIFSYLIVIIKLYKNHYQFFCATVHWIPDIATAADSEIQSFSLGKFSSAVVLSATKKLFDKKSKKCTIKL